MKSHHRTSLMCSGAKTWRCGVTTRMSGNKSWSICPLEMHTKFDGSWILAATGVFVSMHALQLQVRRCSERAAPRSAAEAPLENAAHACDTCRRAQQRRLRQARAVRHGSMYRRPELSRREDAEQASRKHVPSSRDSVLLSRPVREMSWMGEVFLCAFKRPVSVLQCAL